MRFARGGNRRTGRDDASRCRSTQSAAGELVRRSTTTTWRQATGWRSKFTVIEHKANRRPDVVLFVNGLPLGVIELKNPVDENATLGGASNISRRGRLRLKARGLLSV